MSLTGKQIRELNSAYQSIYVKQEPEVENLAITEELFEELCISILAEAFDSYGIEILGSIVSNLINDDHFSYNESFVKWLNWIVSI